MSTDRSLLRHLLLGSSRRARYVTVVSALVLELALLGIDPSFPAEYALRPGTVETWLFHAAFASVATAATIAGAGLVAAWLATYPTMVAVFYSELVAGPSAGFVVLPFENGLLAVALIAAVPALAYGTVGYALATGVRRLVTGAPRKAALRIRH